MEAMTVTETLFTLIPTAFPALALAHFLALISPGPDFFLVVGHAVRRRLRGTVYICLGIALGNALYITLAIGGWSLIRQASFVYSCLEAAGAAYLAWMGVMLLRSSRRPASQYAYEAKPLSPSRQLATGFASAALNPKNAIFYLTLMTVIVGPDATLLQQSVAGLWMTLLVFLWDAGLAFFFSHSRAQQALSKKIPLVEGIAGGILLLFAVTLVLRLLHKYI